MKVIRTLILTILQLLILSPLSMLWGLVVAVKNMAFDLGILKTQKLPKPVISVGNLTVGGSGKTAIVLELIRMFNQKKIAVISRGYGSRVAQKKLYPQYVDAKDPAQFGDEPCMIQERFPKQKVVLDSQRYRGGMWALEQNPELDVFILDDGFQHRRLHRDVNIMVFDVYQYLKKPGLMPLGRMREPLSSLKRADYVFLTKWQHLSQNKIQSIKARLKLFTKAKMSLIHMQISSVRNAQSESLPLGYEGGIIMVSALGAPDAFYNDLKKHFPKAQLIHRRDYPDHYSFTEKDIQILVQEAQSLNAALVCTLKDFVKIKCWDLSSYFYVAYQTVDIPEDTLMQISEDIF